MDAPMKTGGWIIVTDVYNGKIIMPFWSHKTKNVVNGYTVSQLKCIFHIICNISVLSCFTKSTRTSSYFKSPTNWTTTD